MLRAVTLSDERVKRAIEEDWVSARHNQCPGLYCDSTADTREPIPYPPEQMATVREGAGGGNVRLIFCDSDGGVVTSTRGFLPPERMLEELARAREAIATAAELREQAAEGRVPVTSGSKVPTGADRAALLRAIRPRPVTAVLREIEDNIYLKGAIG